MNIITILITSTITIIILLEYWKIKYSPTICLDYIYENIFKPFFINCGYYIGKIIYKFGKIFNIFRDIIIAVYDILKSLLKILFSWINIVKGFRTFMNILQKYQKTTLIIGIFVIIILLIVIEFILIKRKYGNLNIIWKYCDKKIIKYTLIIGIFVIIILMIVIEFIIKNNDKTKIW